MRLRGKVGKEGFFAVLSVCASMLATVLVWGVGRGVVLSDCLNPIVLYCIVLRGCEAERVASDAYYCIFFLDLRDTRDVQVGLYMLWPCMESLEACCALCAVSCIFVRLLC